MPRLYGGRWRIVDGPHLGHGGQGEVFRVVDTTGQLTGEFALKRVRNPARHARFRQEIEAIKAIEHPNVIKLIDHSALDDTAANPEKQFLVVPIAKGGDLTQPSRLSLYTNSIDAVLQVANQVAAGLAAAHDRKVMHRDIKPENILSTGNGHEIWIADFGICLLRERPRVTEPGEVVGPWAFMAPELEDGGQLEVTPSADIYSLGKIIYFLLTGGTILPRERLHEEPFRQIFDKGERYQLMEALLDRMICAREYRLETMQQVMEQLRSLAEWEHNAKLIPLSQAGQADIDRLQRVLQEKRRVANANAAARKQERNTQANVAKTFEVWIGAELQKAAAHIAGGGTLLCTSGPITLQSANWLAAHDHHRVYQPISGIELRLAPSDDPVGKRHFLQVRLCEGPSPLFTMSVRIAGQPEQQDTPTPPRDLQLAMIPYYCQTTNNQPPGGTSAMGFLTLKTSIGTLRNQLDRNRRGPPRLNQFRVSAVTKSYHPDLSQCATFRMSEWPGAIERLRVALIEAIDSFVAFVASDARDIGP